MPYVILEFQALGETGGGVEVAGGGIEKGFSGVGVGVGVVKIPVFWPSKPPRLVSGALDSAELTAAEIAVD